MRVMVQGLPGLKNETCATWRQFDQFQSSGFANIGGSVSRDKRVFHPSPVPKCEGPGAPSTGFGDLTGTGATRLPEFHKGVIVEVVRERSKQLLNRHTRLLRTCIENNILD